MAAKRGAEAQMSKDGFSFQGDGSEEMMDADRPKQATAAQLAKRRLKPLKGRPRAQGSPSASSASFPPAASPSGFGTSSSSFNAPSTNQSVGFNPPSSGFTFGASASGNNPFSFGAAPQQSQPSMGGFNSPAPNTFGQSGSGAPTPTFGGFGSQNGSQSSTNAPSSNIFSFGSQNSSQQNQSNNADQTTSSAPSTNIFGFGSQNASQPTSNNGTQSGSNTPNKNIFGFASQSQSQPHSQSQTSNIFSQSAAPFSFEAQSQTSNTFSQSATPFTFGQKPATDQAPSQTTPNIFSQSAAPFTFGQKSATDQAQPPFQPSRSASPAPAGFNFGQSNTPAASQPAENKSLFSFGRPASQSPAPDASKPTEKSTPFTFGQSSSQAPAPNASKPFSFGQTSSQSPALDASKPAESSSSSKPTFSFGQTSSPSPAPEASRPAETSAPPSFTAPTQNPFQPARSESPAGTPPPFTFGQSQAQSQPQQAPASSTSNNFFNFGQSATQSSGPENGSSGSPSHFSFLEKAQEGKNDAVSLTSKPRSQTPTPTFAFGQPQGQASEKASDKPAPSFFSAPTNGSSSPSLFAKPQTSESGPSGASPSKQASEQSTAEKVVAPEKPQTPGKASSAELNSTTPKANDSAPVTYTPPTGGKNLINSTGSLFESTNPFGNLPSFKPTSPVPSPSKVNIFATHGSTSKPAASAQPEVAAEQSKEKPQARALLFDSPKETSEAPAPAGQPPVAPEAEPEYENLFEKRIPAEQASESMALAPATSNEEPTFSELIDLTQHDLSVDEMAQAEEVFELWKLDDWFKRTMSRTPVDRVFHLVNYYHLRQDEIRSKTHMSALNNNHGKRKAEDPIEGENHVAKKPFGAAEETRSTAQTAHVYDSPNKRKDDRSSSEENATPKRVKPSTEEPKNGSKTPNIFATSSNQTSGANGLQNGSQTSNLFKPSATQSSGTNETQKCSQTANVFSASANKPASATESAFASSTAKEPSSNLSASQSSNMFANSTEEPTSSASTQQNSTQKTPTAKNASTTASLFSSLANKPAASPLRQVQNASPIEEQASFNIFGASITSQQSGSTTPTSTPFKPAGAFSFTKSLNKDSEDDNEESEQREKADAVQTSSQSLFSRASTPGLSTSGSVLDSRQNTPDPRNPFASLSQSQSQDEGDDDDEQDGEGASQDADGDTENGDEVDESPNAEDKNSGKTGGLFDRISKDTDKNTAASNTAMETPKKDSAPNLFAGFKTAGPVTNTWKGDAASPIKFGASMPASSAPPSGTETMTPAKPSTSSNPFANMLGASSTPKPIFGAPSVSTASKNDEKKETKDSGAATPKANPFGGLKFPTSTNSITAAGTSSAPKFTFGSATPTSGASTPLKFGASTLSTSSVTSSLFPPTTGPTGPSLFSGLNSRATTPGISTGVSEAETSGAEQNGSGGGDDDAEAPQAQADFTALTPEEKANHDVLFEAEKAKVLIMVSGQWENKGVGPLRVLKHKESGVTSIIQRVSPTGKVSLNTRLMDKMPYKAQAKQTQFTVVESDKPCAAVARFGSEELAKKFGEVCEENKTA